MEEIEIPNTVDEPVHVLMWRFDDALPVFVAIILGMMIEQLILCLGLSLGTMNLYKRFRDGHPEGYALHLLYWIGLGLAKGFTVPTPFTKRIVP